MTAVIDLIVLCVIIIWLSYRGASRWQWLPVMALVLGFISFFHTLSWIWLSVLWAVYAVVALLTAVGPIRRMGLSRPIFRFFKRQLPAMSDTEKAAIEAGDTWWDKALLSGRPHWVDILKSPRAVLSEKEQHFLDNEVNTLCAMLDEWHMKEQGNDLPQAVWDYIRKKGFFGLIMHPEHGGLGFSELAHSSIITKIATRSVSAAVTVMVPNSLGPAQLLVQYGTQAQKAHYLPRLAKGEEIPCFGLTGLEAGSDAGGITDTGIVCHGEFEGQSILGIKLNWHKRYITLAPVATLLGLAFKLYDPDHLLGDESTLGITLCLIPTHCKGVDHSHRHLPMNLAFMNGASIGQDVFVPLDWIIGGPVMAGQGWRMLMDCLSTGRGISLPAMSAASAQVCYRTTGVYASVRKQFNMPIGHFEGVEEALARIAGYSYMMEAVRQITATAVDQHIKPSVISAIAKYHCTEMSRHIIADAMDVHAGRAIQMGPRNYLGDAYLAAPIGITVEGSNIITRNLMIFGQGMIRCHPYLYDEIKAAHDPLTKNGLKVFDKLIIQHIGHAWSNFVRTVVKGLLPAITGSAPVRDGSQHFYKKLTRMSSALAFCAEIGILVTGGSLKRKERLSARYADILSYLYLSTATLKYYHDNGHHEDDLSHLNWVLEQNLYQIGIAFMQLFANFPNKLIGCLLKRLVFPWGCYYQKPSDQADHVLARLLLSPTKLRDRLTALCYVPDDPNDRLGRMDQAFKQHFLCLHILKKIKKQLGHHCLHGEHNLVEIAQIALSKQIITPEEAEQLKAYEQARIDVLAVDTFKESNLLGSGEN